MTGRGKAQNKALHHREHPVVETRPDPVRPAADAPCRA